MKTIISPYRPHPKQALFHSVYAPYKLFLAGIGTGKTLAGVHEILNLARQNPGYDGLISSPTFPMLRDVIITQWEEFIPSRLYTLHKKDQYIELWTGQKLFLRSFERPEGIRGLNLGYAWADEMAIVNNQDAWKILVGRVGRTKGAPYPSIIATTTPRGWNWLTKKFLKNPGKDYKTIRARSSDNPHFNPELLRRLREEYSDDYAAQELDAEIIESGGKPIDITDVHTNWEFSSIDNLTGRRRVVGSVDWGFSAPACILIFMQIVKTGKWYLVEEFYKRRVMSSDFYGKMKQLKNKWGVKRFYADSSEPERIATVNGMGISCQPVKKGAGSITNGITEARSLLKVDHKGNPGCYVHRSCTNFIRESDSAYYEGDESEKIICPEGDHAIDCFRYFAREESRGPQIVGIG